MNVYAILHTGLCGEATITTHEHAEAARQYVAGSELASLVVVGSEDLNLSGPAMVNLHNLLRPDAPTKKFSTKKDGQRRVFAALEQIYGQQAHEPFNPVPTVPGEKDTDSTATKQDPSEGSVTNGDNTMATKKKAKKAKTKKAAGDRKPRVSAPLYSELPTSLKPPVDMKCGTYIRSLIMLGKPTDKILEKVATNYPDSSAKASDVSWNKGKLKAAGKKIPDAA